MGGTFGLAASQSTSVDDVGVVARRSSCQCRLAVVRQFNGGIETGFSHKIISDDGTAHVYGALSLPALRCARPTHPAGSKRKHGEGLLLSLANLPWNAANVPRKLELYRLRLCTRIPRRGAP